ncbi:MAG: hypothetical protein ACE5IL_03865 [Myxococcota bacterium]
MAMRRRGGRSRSTQGSGLLERLRAARGLALRDPRLVERVPGLPAGIELGVARAEGERSVALALAARDRGDLVGWGRVAAGLEQPNGPCETWLVAPAFSRDTREAAAWLAERGSTHHLVSLPSLASAADEPHAEEVFPISARIPWAGSPSLGARLLRVLDGAAALGGVGALRSITGGYALYLGGRAVLRVHPDGDGLAVSLLAPERREIQVTEDGVARWAVELHESIAEMTRDPRVLDRALLEREAAARAAAERLGVRVTARWLPCGADVADPIDWVGLDGAGRPVLGAVRGAVGLPDVPGLLAAVLRAELERETWAPGSHGILRLVLVSERIEARAREILASVGIDVDVESRGEVETRADPFAAAGASEAEGRGRRRSRRRRRGRPRRPELPDEEAVVEPEAAVEDAAEPSLLPDAAEPIEAREEPLGSRSPEVAGELLPLSAFPGESGDDAEAGQESRSVGEEETTPEARPALRDEGEGEPAGAPPEPRPEAAEPGSSDLEEVPVAEPDEAPDGVDLEIEATLEGEPVEEPPVVVPEPPRRRHARAAIVVAAEPWSILAALVLARERRGIVSFVVATQDGLMDYFRTRATDLAENVDLQLVGFTAQPVPMEVLSSVALYRGRVDWFDHHEWPVEDAEGLRDAIGADAIYLAEGALRPLAAILPVCERRSRFTDKLVDLSGSRLSESDMQKWGRRVVGLLHRLAENRGECRNEIAPILAGKPSELPEAPEVFKAEEEWVEAHDPRIVYFGEYQMVVVHAPDGLDGGELARQLRVRTGSRLSMVCCGGDDRVEVACNEERRHINVLGLVERIASRLPWAEARPGGDRTGRLRIEDLARHPERAEIVLGEIVRQKSTLYG